MVFTATYHSPLGLVVIESDGEVLTGLRFADENVCSDRAERGETETGMMEWGDTSGGKLVCGKASSTMPIIAATTRWLDDYFSGKRTENAVMGAKTDNRIVARPKGTAFQQRVWQALLTIPYGKTVSYGELARMVGCKSAQAVGQAVGANPVALLIPCHRIIAAHGRIGGYEYGIEIKKRLLDLEQL